MEDIKTCKLCFDSFNTGERKAYTISPCSHYYCILCLNKLTKQECPECRREIESIAINRTMLDMLNSLPSYSSQNDEFSNLVKSIRDEIEIEKEKKKSIILKDFRKLTKTLDKIEMDYKNLSNSSNLEETRLKMSLMKSSLKFESMINVFNTIGNVAFKNNRFSSIFI